MINTHCLLRSTWLVRTRHRTCGISQKKIVGRDQPIESGSPYQLETGGVVGVFLKLSMAFRVCFILGIMIFQERDKTHREEIPRHSLELIARDT